MGVVEAALLFEYVKNELGRGHHVLLLLSGESGWGKTTLAHGLLKYLNAEPTVSPSYAFHLQTRLQGTEVDHWDLDRVQSQDDLESTGFTDWIREWRADAKSKQKTGESALSPKLAIIEWPERMREHGFIGDFRLLSGAQVSVLDCKLEGPPEYLIHVQVLDLDS